MEEKGIFTSGHALTVNVAQNSEPTEELPMPTPVTAASPMPISSSIPVTGDFSALKRGRGKPRKSTKKPLIVYDFKDDGTTYSLGSDFTPHELIVNSGEDVADRIFLLSKEFPAISLLSGNGTISSVKLVQSDSCGGVGTSKFEGTFDLLTLNGSYVPTLDGLTKERVGKITVSLAYPDGRVFGGEVAGPLIASSPVQVVAWSFVPGKQLEQKKGKKIVNPTSPVVPPA
ncbi:AT-hook motif nuclear-localized protein 3-like isoform X1 [Cicer arietinum]|uniref:AT-hook motif nuclear-localized protein n=1 Tax=Cicer arietinum TaxID=3827 RepID=A0A3Q7WXV2_CICAR|nr:AT-hook motif nuclear-localized protein 3-like isoform X1 [Cicer arietinum]